MSSATLPRAMSGEWIKIRSVRSTGWTLLAFVVVGIGIGIAIASSVANAWATQMSASEKAAFDAASESLQGLALGQLILGVLGVLVVTAEFSTGTIGATLAAVPRRLVMLAAKSVVFAGLACAAATVTCVAAFALAQAVLSPTGAGASLADPAADRVIAGAVLYLVMIGLIGLGLGTIIRSTAGAITTLVGIVFVVPILVRFLPTSIRHAVNKWDPNSMGEALTSTVHQPDLLSPTMSALMLTVYAAVVLGAGAILLVRRDA